VKMAELYCQQPRLAVPRPLQRAHWKLVLSGTSYNIMGLQLASNTIFSLGTAPVL